LIASAYDDVTRPTGFLGGYNATLTAYGEAVREMAREYNLTVADTNTPLVGALARAHALDADLSTKVIPDRVHPQAGGHMVMASAVLKAWNAPDTVADIEINAADGSVVKSLGSKVSGLSATPQSITFTHTDSCLPWPLDRDPDRNKDTILMLNTTDIEQALNRYVLKIDNLPAAKYMLKVDGENIATLSREQLQSGIDLAAVPALAPNKQANTLLTLIRRHGNFHNQKWREVQVPNSSNGKSITTDIQARMDNLDKQEAEVLKTIPAANKPKPHTVVLTPAM
ncbi:MAG: Lysophospholipase and related esterase, partial [Chthonomonadales bacterium]|nr:Lysophospholipase and related esterase [Chthonomonadales bacterium]